MLHRIYILCCFLCMTLTSESQHLQLVENRGEIGFLSGKSSFIGDIAPDITRYKNTFGAYYKKQFNDYGGVRLNYEKIQLTANDTLSNNIYAKTRRMYFSREFHDISLMSEFNFTRYLPGNKKYRFTPYLGFGVGYLLEVNQPKRSVDTSSIILADLNIDSLIYPNFKLQKGYFHFPLQIGFKLNLSKRFNLFAELMYRFTFSDQIDLFSDDQLLVHAQKIATGTSKYNYQGSRSGKDQFFTLKGGIAYNLIKIYGEEKWKPGKKSKLAGLKEKERESNQNKPGFFSRLKFKRN